jgi:hypothetical protein
MSKWLGHPFVVTALVGLVVLLPIAGLATLGRWTLDPVTFLRPGEGVQPGTWSADGTRFIFHVGGAQFLVIRVSDGAVVRSGYGSWPVWVDNDTIDSVQDTGLKSSHVDRMTVSTGRARTIVPNLGSVRLVGRGVVDVAASGVSNLETTIIDPIDGRKIAYVPGIRALDWLRPGVLIGETSTFEIPPGLPPQSLLVWTLRDGARAIGPGLKKAYDVFAYSPTGDAIACVCTAADAPPGNPPQGIYRVPIDGSPATRRAMVTAGSFNGEPLMSWFDDGSIVFMDGAGLHRIGPDGANTTIPVDPGDLPGMKLHGRAFRFGNAIALASQLVSSATIGTSKLTIMGLSGEVGYRQTFSTGTVALILDPARTQAVLSAGTQYFVLRHQ